MQRHNNLWVPEPKKILSPYEGHTQVTTQDIYLPGPCILHPPVAGFPIYKTSGPGILRQRLIACTRPILMAPFGSGAGGTAMGARRRASSWNPSAVSPEGWWRGDLGHSAADAATFSPWTNQGSESALDLAQATSTLRFTFDEVNTNYNSQSSCHADGSDRMYSGQTAVWEVADGVDMSWLLVASIDTVAQHSSASTYSSSTGGFVIQLRNGGATRLILEDNSTNEMVAGVSSVATSTLVVFACEYINAVSTGTDTLNLWIDGASDATDTGDLLAIEPSGGSGIRNFILGSGSIAAGDLVGDIGEYVFRKSIWSVGDDGDLELYLENRYNLTLAGVFK